MNTSCFLWNRLYQALKTEYTIADVKQRIDIWYWSSGKRSRAWEINKDYIDKSMKLNFSAKVKNGWGRENSQG